MKQSAKQSDFSRDAAMLRDLAVLKPLPSLPDQPPVEAGTVCLSFIDLRFLQERLRDLDLHLFLSGWLDDEEQGLFSRFSLVKRRLEWLGGCMTAKSALLHLAISGDQPLTPPLIPLLPTPSGRPHCARPLFDRHGSPLFFSISHSGNSASAVAAADLPCGIDIQVFSPSLTGIRDRFCVASERKLLQGNPAIASCGRMEQLALLWCAKEAFRKTLPISPPPGFREIELHGVPQSVTEGFHVPMRFTRDGRSLAFTATAWLRDEGAAALTLIANPGGSIHG